MEYAISIGIVAIFFCLFMFTRPKVSARYFDVFDDAEYEKQSEIMVRSLTLPKEGGKTEAKKYSGKIKLVMLKIKRKKYSGFFDKFTAREDDIKNFLKEDFSSLDELPSAGGEPRAVKLARFCLAHSGYNFDESRVKTLLEAHNRHKTLSFSEITEMRSAFIYVMLERLCYLYLQLDTLAKIYDLSAKYVYNPILLNEKYKKLTKSKLFLSICALCAGYKMEYFANVHSEVTDRMNDEISAIFETVETIRAYDFSRYYTPLEILDKFEVFALAPIATKRNFLALIKEESDRENIDEFLYTVRLEKYMQSASAGHISVKRANILSYVICVVNHKRDITMLATALGSKHFMNLYFEEKLKPKRIFGKSITKMLEYENTFEPIYKFHTVNFGISTAGGKLRVMPSLPRQIDRADVIFDVNGVKNTLHIERGEQKEMYLGDTLISGVEQIKLGDSPVDVTLKIPKN